MRERALPNEIVRNPYRLEVEAIAAKHTKRSARQVAARLRDVALWDQGWTECEAALMGAKKTA